MNLTGIPDKYAIYGMLFSVSNRLQTFGDKLFTDMTMKQHFLMISLGMFDQPPSLKEMAEINGSSYQNIKRMANQLEKAGYLKILPDSHDKRKQRLVSTGKFEELATALQDVTANMMDTLFQGLSQEDLITTLKTLVKMDQNLGGMMKIAENQAK